LNVLFLLIVALTAHVSVSRDVSRLIRQPVVAHLTYEMPDRDAHMCPIVFCQGMHGRINAWEFCGIQAKSMYVRRISWESLQNYKGLRARVYAELVPTHKRDLTSEDLTSLNREWLAAYKIVFSDGTVKEWRKPSELR
jgi:hypothetical protein